MKRYSQICSIAFGVMMLILSAAILIETVIRKLFSISIGGVDEMSGYAIAWGAPLAFVVTLVSQSHIRINLLHMRMPARAQAVLNAMAALTLGILALALFYFSVETVRETHLFRSIAQTPWATPLLYPQALWLVAMAAFALPAAYLALRATLLLLRGEWQALNLGFSPETAADELKAELDDLSRR